MENESGSDKGAASSRREEILEIAAEVFAERGIKEATVRDIGEAAGILSGSLYYHFDSKEQIVLELLLPSVEANYKRLLEISQESSGIAALAGLIRATIEVTSQNPYRSMVLRNGSKAFVEFASLEPVADLLRKTIRIWIEVVEQGMADGELRSDIEPELAVRAMLDGTSGSSRWFIGRNQMQPEHVAEKLIALYIGGLRKQ